MGIVFPPPPEKKQILSGRRAEIRIFTGGTGFLGMLQRPPPERPLKTLWNAPDIGHSRRAYVRPSGFKAVHPHTGQTEMSKFQIVFSNSAMERPIYLRRKR